MLVYLSRHAQKASSSRDPRQGITKFGKRQASALGGWLKGKNIGAIYSSDLPRALDTAEVAGQVLGLKPKVMGELREINIPAGSWEDYLARYHPDINRHIGGGESLRRVMERGEKALRQIVTESEGKNIAIFAHGIFIKALLYALGYQNYLLQNESVPETGTTILESRGGRVVLLGFVGLSHLPLSLRLEGYLRAKISRIFGN